MQIAHKQLALLSSLVLMVAGAAAQSSAPPDCTGLTDARIEDALHPEPLECKLLFAPSCQRIPQLTDGVIFLGTVTHIEEGEGKVLLDGHCDRTGIQTVTMTVNESFSGPLPSTMTIHAGFNTSFFIAKEKALVFASKQHDGTFVLSKCGKTDSIDNRYPNPALAEDLAYLRSREELPPTATLFGTTFVVLPNQDDKTALAVSFPNQTVTVQGPRSGTIITPRDGSFRMENLPPGAYTLHIDTPFPAFPGKDQKIELLPRGCARADFYIESRSDYHQVLAAMKARSKQ